MAEDVPAKAQVGFFRTYGYVKVPGLLSREETGRLRREVTSGISSSYRVPTKPAAEASGYDGFYLPLMGDRSPTSRALVGDARLLGLAERLLGRRVVPKPAKGILYRDTSPWHSDSDDPELHAIKLVCYLEPLTEETGALRVLPGSQVPAYGAILRHYREDRPAGAPVDEDDEASGWPGVTLETRPGDALIFDVHLWHASLYGRDRLQWSVSYAAVPETDAESAAVRHYVASFLSAGHHYDREAFPYYDPEWLTPGRPKFAQVMAELGLLDDHERPV